MTAEALAVAAARTVARHHGVPCDDAVVLAGGSNVLVHLRPAPVVARVMTGTAELHDDVERWLAREVAVGAFLGERGLAVAPSDLLPPGPHERDGLWMTFWEFAEHDPSPPRPGPAELAGALRDLHGALAGFPGRLGPLSDIRDWLDRLLAQVRPSPGLTAADLERLRARLHALTPTVFDGPLPAQAIHGDVSLSNLLHTATGLVWNDLEDVCAGPVHWDVAALVVEARTREWGEAFVGDFLRFYGGPDLAELEDFVAAHHLYSTIWRAFSAQHRA